jgi:SAM-dependent methyltransferase
MECVTSLQTYGFGMTLQDWMEPTRRSASALSFGPAADLYDRIRPSYPRAALDWALAPLGPGAWRVADIGAGTGIMTRLMVEAGHVPLPIEPDEGMRAQLERATPDVTALAGSAESIPLPDASLDAAVAAQAYHWFDHDRAHAELARAIRSGGVFAAIWNDRDESVAWVHDYSRIIDSDRGYDRSGYIAGRGGLSFGDGFVDPASATFAHVTPLTPDMLVALMQSRSYYLTAASDRQSAMVREVRELISTHPDLAGRTAFELPYVTTVYRGIRA